MPKEHKGIGPPPVVKRQLAMLHLIRWGTIFNGVALFGVLAALIYIIKILRFVKLLVDMHHH